MPTAQTRPDTIFIPAAKYLYRVVHRIMEGDCDYDHGPYLVDVGNLEVDKFPVTNAMFKIFVDETNYAPKDSHNFLRDWSNGTFPNGFENNPVVWISQNDAKAYAAWRGCRLLYDHEWQYIAAGKENFSYPWGNRFDKTKCNGRGKFLTPVDYYPQGASPFGVIDMCGNAHEWVGNLVDDGMHHFTFLRGGSYFQADHFWHTDGGARPTSHHLKFQLLNEGQNRCGTTSFRCAKEVLAND